jgi:hypothetical protein
MFGGRTGMVGDNYFETYEWDGTAWTSALLDENLIVVSSHDGPDEWLTSRLLASLRVSGRQSAARRDKERVPRRAHG